MGVSQSLLPELELSSEHERAPVLTAVLVVWNSQSSSMTRVLAPPSVLGLCVQT